MEIKTTQQIWDMNGTRVFPRTLEKYDKRKNKKWVAVDDIKKALDDFVKYFEYNEPVQMQLDDIYDELSQKGER